MIGRIRQGFSFYGILEKGHENKKKKKKKKKWIATSEGSSLKECKTLYAVHVNRRGAKQLWCWTFGLVRSTLLNKTEKSHCIV